MPSFLKRMWNLVRGKAAAALDRFEDPEEQLSVFVGELDDQVQDLQRSVAGAIADEKRLKLQLDELLRRAGDWERRALLALAEGNEDLARDALLKKEECLQQSLTLRSSWEAQEEATTKLKDSLRSAKDRIQEAKRKYTLLLAEYRSAQTKQKIASSMTLKAPESPMLHVERLREKIQAIEAESEASRVLHEDGTDLDLEGAFLDLEKQKRGEEALAALKAKLDDQKQLESGKGDSASRVAELKRSLDDA